MLFLRKSRLYVRRKINRLLGMISRNTPWHMWLGEDKGFCISRDTIKPRGLCSFYICATWCSRSNGSLTARLSVSDDRSDSIEAILIFPWVVQVYVSLELCEASLQVTRRVTGKGGKCVTGMSIGPGGIGAEWMENSPWRRGFSFGHPWSKIGSELKRLINGTPIYVIEASTPLQFRYEQPPGCGFAASTHDIMLIPTRKIKRWPRFWKWEECVNGIDVKVHEPPPIVPDVGSVVERPESIYAMFVPGSRIDFHGAVQAYRTAIEERRASFL